MKNISTVIMLLLVMVLQYLIWINPQGLVSLIEMSDKLMLKKRRAQLLIQQNQRLKEEIDYLKSDSEAAELRARSTLGMIKDGERYYKVDMRDLVNGVEKVGQ